MNTELHAILRLLQDDDPETVGLVKEQLAGRNADFLRELQRIRPTDDERVSRHVSDIAARIEARAAEAALAQLCANFTPASDLENAAFLLARVLQPGVDEADARASLDQWGARLAHLLSGTDGALERVMFLGDFLGHEVKLRGNTGDYYHPANSMLPLVIESRVGIPITLALVFILVGRRAGMIIEGVNFPGHFLARHEGVLFDPFDGGRILSKADCRDILERQSLAPQPSFFAAADSVAVFVRLLANLLYIYQTAEEHDQSERVSRWIRLLTVR